MKVRETLKVEMDAIIKDLIGKIDTDKEELSINEIFDLAEEQGCFSQKDYVYSNDTETLEDLLVFSLGLSNLWRNWIAEHPEAPRTDVNYLVIDFMKHMWGLEKVPTLKSGNKEEASE